MADEAMIGQAPDSVRVAVLHTESLPPSLYQYDRVVVSGVMGLNHEAVQKLVDVDLTCWLHHEMPQHPTLAWMFQEAKWTIALTDRHAEHEAQWAHGVNWATNPGWFDTSECYETDKFGDTLWAHRDVWHKGLYAARDWAVSNDAHLTVLMNASRQEVLFEMARHQRFILLSEIFDPCPRAVMEAQLSGCELVVNDRVGWFDEPKDVLKDRIDNAGREFWRLVCE